MSTYESKMMTMREVRDEDFIESKKYSWRRLWEIVMHMVELNILL
jgi:hypothetical protein